MSWVRILCCPCSVVLLGSVWALIVGYCMELVSNRQDVFFFSVTVCLCMYVYSVCVGTISKDPGVMFRIR